MKKRVGKGELANKLKERLSEKGFVLSTRDASMIIDALVGAIVDIVKEKSTLNVPNFGTFVIRTTKARKARNPRTGETVQVPEKKRLRFRPSYRIQKLIEQA